LPIAVLSLCTVYELAKEIIFLQTISQKLDISAQTM